MCKPVPWAFLQQKRNANTATKCSFFVYLFSFFSEFIRKPLGQLDTENERKYVVVVKLVSTNLLSEPNNIQVCWTRFNKFAKAELNLS